MSEVENQIAAAEVALQQLEAAAATARKHLDEVRRQHGLRSARREITPEQYALLIQHGLHFQAMSNHVRSLDDDAMATLLAACRAVDATNVPWTMLKAARFLEEEIAIVSMVRWRSSQTKKDPAL
jgi:hypothetical protein